MPGAINPARIEVKLHSSRCGGLIGRAVGIRSTSMELMFGGMPDAGRFVIAFVLVLGLIGAGTLLWRRFGVGPLSPHGSRGRQPRLAVIDAAAVDARRRLVLIKRDNVEHLLMIGGPTDIVVESNITRSALSREPRPIPESSSRHVMSTDGPDWGLPLEPAARTLRATGDLDGSVPEPPARTAREAMVDSMHSVRSSPVRRSPASEPSTSSEDDIESAAPTPPPSPAEAGHGAPPASEPRRTPSPLEAQRPQPAAAEPGSQTSDATESKRAAASGPRAAQSEENSLAEMAQRLEAALRRPTKPNESPATSPAPVRSPGRINAKASAKLPDQLSSPSPDLKLLSGKTKAEPPAESLEDEMAKMLGRSPAKQ
jgi:flagellar protein FliO/FliZ